MKIPRVKVPLGLDWSLYIIPLVLATFGIAIIYSITYGAKNQIAIDQIIFTIASFLVAIGLTIFDYRILKGLNLFLYIIGVALLLVVLFTGEAVFGAARWIDLGIYKLQPAELFKLIAIIVMAKYFSDWKEVDLKKILLIIIMIGVPMVLVLIEPDLGTTTVLFASFWAILFASPIKKSYLIIAIAVMVALSPLGWKMLKPYQKGRIEAFINPASDPHGAGYNVNQAKIAVGSGGIWGRGLGKGSQSQLNFLPVAHTDFIFAGTAEATGFIGSMFVITLLTILVARVIYIAKIAKDDFGMYLAIGISVIFLFQMLVNIGMNMGIMPVTGIPLPFVSYGGSSMLTNMAAIGILQSIYLRHRKISF